MDRRRHATEVHQAQSENTYPEQGQPAQPQSPGGIQAREGRAQNDQPLPQRAEVSPAPTAPANQRPSEQTSKLPRPVIASFVLTPGMTRDVEEINKLVIPRGAQFVKLQLNIEATGEHKAFRASLQRVGASEIWRRTFPKSRSGGRNEALTLKLPVGLFADGDYLLTLTGATVTGEPEIVGDYPFRVSKKR